MLRNIATMDVNLKNKVERTIPLPPLFPFPSPPRIGPLNPGRKSVERCKLPSRVWDEAPAESEYDAF